VKSSSVLLVLVGVGAALLGATLVMFIMPSRIDEFIAHGVEIPGITLLLLTKPWLTLLFPILTLALGLALGQSDRRGLLTCLVGLSFLVLSILMIVLFGFAPFR